MVSEEHSSCYLCDLDVSLPLVLDAHDSAVNHCELAGTVLVLPGKQFAVWQRFYSQHHCEFSDQLVFQIRRVKDMALDEAEDLLLLSYLVLYL